MRAPLIVAPELFCGTGGVQTFSLQLIAAVDGILEAKAPVITLNDRRQDLPADFEEGRWIGASGGGKLRKLRFIGNTLRAPKGTLTLSTHPNPALWLSHRKRMIQQPFICVTHGIDVWNLPGESLKKSLREADRLLAVSRFTAASLKEQLGPGAPSISLLPNTIDTERYYPGPPQTPWRKRLNLGEDDKVMLTVGRVSQTEHLKGYDHILQVLPECFAKHPELRWVLAGHGDDLQRIQEKTKQLGIADQCRFPGYVAEEELPDLYRSSDLFVLPSRKEGFGIVFLEAIASGLPVIAGDRDGSVDALVDGELGRLIDPEDGGQLVDAISETVSQLSPDPKSLHEACTRHFGFAAFQEKVRTIIQPYL